MYKIKYHPSLENRMLNISNSKLSKFISLYPFEIEIIKSNQSRNIYSFEYNFDFKTNNSKEFVEVNGIKEIIPILESLEITIERIKPQFQDKQILINRYVYLVNEFAFSGIMD